MGVFVSTNGGKIVEIEVADTDDEVWLCGCPSLVVGGEDGAVLTILKTLEVRRSERLEFVDSFAVTVDRKAGLDFVSFRPRQIDVNLPRTLHRF